jgi:hypothetical protein
MSVALYVCTQDCHIYIYIYILMAVITSVNRRFLFYIIFISECAAIN